MSRISQTSPQRQASAPASRRDLLRRGQSVPILSVGDREFDLSNLCLKEEKAPPMSFPKSNNSSSSSPKKLNSSALSARTESSIRAEAILYPSEQDFSESSTEEIIMEALFDNDDEKRGECRPPTTFPMQRPWESDDHQRGPQSGTGINRSSPRRMFARKAESERPLRHVFCEEEEDDGEDYTNEDYYDFHGMRDRPFEYEADQDETATSVSLLTWDGPSPDSYGPRRSPPSRRRHQWQHQHPSHPALPHHGHQYQSGDDEYGRVQIEVAPGFFKILRGARETMEAIDSGKSIMVHCLACNAVLSCIADCELVVCPDCQVLSPVEVAAESYQWTCPEEAVEPQEDPVHRSLPVISSTNWEAEDHVDGGDQDAKPKAYKKMAPQSVFRSGVGLGLKMR